MKRARPKILVVYPFSFIDTNPTMTLLLETLVQREVDVDILAAYGNEHLPPKPYGRTVRIESFPADYYYRLFSGDEFLDYGSLRGFPKRMALWFLQRHKQPDYALGADPVVFGLLRAWRYSAMVGVDPYGIAWADLLNRWSKRPLVYISFELMFADEDGEPALKVLERDACKRVQLLLIQDEERAATFCREKDFPAERAVMVPVAPPYREVGKSDYLRKSLGIPPQKRIVLFCGNLQCWSSRDELADTVFNWPEEFCLVVHSFSVVDSEIKPYLDRYKQTGRIYVTAGPVDREELPRLIASADYGLAPYVPVATHHWTTGKNLYHLGLASGKVAYYALCGLPMLARSLPVFDREFAIYGCGKVYRHPSETGNLLKEMEKDYAQYSAEARRFYRERLDPAAGMDKFCSRFLTLLESQRRTLPARV